jgi:glucose-fructose oxidoreductase
MPFTSRRTLIKNLALGTGALILSRNRLVAGERSTKAKLGVALVGLGYYSTDLLAPALQQTKHCYLAGIVTGSPDKAEKWKRQYNIPDKNIYNYENFDSISKNPEIDVVYVVLPPSMHREYVVRAAAAGKHVWCEKPMAMSVAECQDMIDACKKHKRFLSIGYRLQHEPNTKRYREIVNKKLLGNVKSVECGAGYRETRTDHWKQKKEMGGGVLGDMGVYSIQGARLGSGMEPVRVVSAKITAERPDIYKDGLDETVEAVLEFPGGTRANIKTSFAQNINYLNIICEKGDIRMSPFSGYAGVRGTSPLGEINTPYEVPWQQANQMDDDALAIKQGKPAPVPGEEGLKDIRIVEAIKQAAATGKPVDLKA